MTTRSYLDARAPLHPVAREAVLAALDEGWADPTRLHSEGRRAATLLAAARATLAESLGCRPEEVHATPSHTASLHAAVAAVTTARRRVAARVVHSAVERGALIAAAREVGSAPVAVDRTGRVELETWRQALGEPAALAALQLANPEVGTLQPIAAAHEVAAAAGVPLLVDGGAGVGHVPVPEAWDLLAADPTSWGGPAGVGVLAVRSRVRVRPVGPEDPDPWAPGGVSVPLLVGAAAGLRAVLTGREAAERRRRALLERIRACVAGIPDVDVPGAARADESLPHVMTFSCLYVDGEALLGELDRRGIAVGSGSACTASSLEPSHVLVAMGVLTHGNVRLTLSLEASDEDVDRLCAALPDAVATVRRALGADAL
ncbi:aminotransferase class V-fold PLP-dependent enzyme [Actinotalea sp. M2MS4P-6]|uniref:aminotransferase class V-fold PLP-dependent enzyme n=1 Tax=Actinotalea sp. M2MS4P-6 TaxID=2983762 RepID=UPI0021E44683|nr:aminotransferase class V-fold PLP-dependent enzyme [Actinotalea sp. M2MS4P-6]MCV2396448.1 aminotransferase class V-fold PLP-dependent enzyme [Actinotalea sp. M2MS4P-6]